MNNPNDRYQSESTPGYSTSDDEYVFSSIDEFKTEPALHIIDQVDVSEYNSIVTY